MANKGPMATKSTAHSNATSNAGQPTYIARSQNETLNPLGVNKDSTAKAARSTNVELGEQH